MRQLPTPRQLLLLSLERPVGVPLLLPLLRAGWRKVPQNSFLSEWRSCVHAFLDSR